MSRDQWQAALVRRRTRPTLLFDLDQPKGEVDLSRTSPLTPGRSGLMTPPKEPGARVSSKQSVQSKKPALFRKKKPSNEVPPSNPTDVSTPPGKTQKHVSILSPTSETQQTMIRGNVGSSSSGSDDDGSSSDSSSDGSTSTGSSYSGSSSNRSSSGDSSSGDNADSDNEESSPEAKKTAQLRTKVKKLSIQSTSAGLQGRKSPSPRPLRRSRGQDSSPAVKIERKNGSVFNTPSKLTSSLSSDTSPQQVRGQSDSTLSAIQEQASKLADILSTAETMGNLVGVKDLKASLQNFLDQLGNCGNMLSQQTPGTPGIPAKVCLCGHHRYFWFFFQSDG